MSLLLPGLYGAPMATLQMRVGHHIPLVENFWTRTVSRSTAFCTSRDKRAADF